MEGISRALPKNADYSQVLPLAVESRSRRRTFFPNNGQQFTSDGNNIIRIDISASAFLDPKHSYLRFRMTNNCAVATMGIDFGGGHGFIRRLRIEQAGTVLSDVNHYGRLMASIILPSQGGIDSVAHRSLTEAQRFGNADGPAGAMAPMAGGDVTGAVANTAPQSNALIAAVNGQYVFSIPLMNGLLGTTQSKLVPLQLLSSSPITIEIELSDLLDVGCFSVAPAAGENYTIDDVRYVASLVEVGPEVDANLRMVRELSGGKLVLNGVDYTHFSGNIPANATGQQTINVPARRKSIKSLLFVGASQTYAAAFGAGAHAAVYNQSFGGNFNMTDYFMKIGSTQYPATPVACNWTVANVPFARGEALSELAKCWGTLSSTHGTGSLSTINYATVSTVVAGMTVPVVAGAGGINSLRFCPFGLDLEAFQRTAIESGINTASQSLPISLILNIGVAQAQAVNVDAYISYDSLYYIDEIGSIRVAL